MSTTAAANPSFVPQSPSHWVPDEKRSSCKSCHKDFTMFNRRHHCRSCREVFCGDCSDFRLLTRDPKDKTVVTSVRACRPCFDKFRGRKARGPKARSATATTKPRDSHTEADKPAAPDAQHKPVEMEMPEQHFDYEGEDADITGHEQIRIEEDDDHYVYPDNGQHQDHAQGHNVTLFAVLGPDGQPVEQVGRDTVMAAQGSVVLPSSQAHGGLQFVPVDNSASRAPAAASATSQPATATAGLPSDTAAVFQESHVTARTPVNSSFQAVDKTAMATKTAAVGGEKDEFDRTDGAVEGSEEFLNIPSDALASVKNSELMARHQQLHPDKDEGDMGETESEEQSGSADMVV